MNHGNLEQQDHIVAGALNYIKDTHNTNTNWYICPHCGQSSIYKINTQNTTQHNYICMNCGQVQNPIIMGNSFMPITL